MSVLLYSVTVMFWGISAYLDSCNKKLKIREVARQTFQSLDSRYDEPFFLGSPTLKLVLKSGFRVGRCIQQLLK